MLDKDRSCQNGALLVSVSCNPDLILTNHQTLDSREHSTESNINVNTVPAVAKNNYFVNEFYYGYSLLVSEGGPLEPNIIGT